MNGYYLDDRGNRRDSLPPGHRSMPDGWSLVASITIMDAKTQQEFDRLESTRAHGAAGTPVVDIELSADTVRSQMVDDMRNAHRGNPLWPEDPATSPLPVSDASEATVEDAYAKMVADMRTAHLSDAA